MLRNKLSIIHNPYQGKYKKVLCVCSVGLLRSPTVAVVLSQEPYNYNTRACGLDKDYALIPITEELIEWADEIVCMDKYQEQAISKQTEKPVINLKISDSYNYRDDELIQCIKVKYEEEIS